MTFMETAASAGIGETLEHSGFGTLETVFEALGRALIVLDGEFRIIRASRTLDQIAEPGMAGEAIGKPIEDLVGAKLFGPSDTLRETLTRGGREEGRRAVLRCGASTARLVSLTAAPVPRHVSNHCDPRARYLIVVRPAEDEDALLQSMLASHGLVSRSPAMLRIVHVVESLHRSLATVLITGESGTGKEVLARAIHSHSQQNSGPFVAVNCGALPSDLLESEFFGHVKGAFTGAVRDRMGRVELAGGGTLFLDEVGDIPLHLQVKLLRVLQERQFERVGESAPRPMTARIIAATNRDLLGAIRDGRFREDLYYRLRVVPIHIAPLRERPEDIGVIAQHLLAHIGGRAGRAVRLSPDTLTAMERYPWPGNVRELENSLEYTVALCSGQTLQIEDFPEEIRTGGGAAERPVPGSRTEIRTSPRFEVPVPVEAGAPERARIVSVLERYHWNRQRAAEALGLSRSTLWRRMPDLGIS